METRYGHELIFISQIMRDGKSVNDLTDVDMSFENQTQFRIYCLSLSRGNYMASEMNTYVVKLKQ